MCAIAGYFGNCDREHLQNMLLALKHRGPDDSGMYVSGSVGLGNNRLSIIDLSKKGHQPLFNEDNTACIVYNGEVYNFDSIKRRLTPKHKFKSYTDTEVILHAYEEWGTGCLQHLNGMFAFVIYDKKEKLLFGARDRLGEKPLKYFWDGKFFAFASEIKGLLCALAHTPEIDPSAINDFLTLQYVPAPATGFRNIYKLPPASYFIFQNGELKISKYWQLDFSHKLELAWEEWEDLLLDKLQDSVKSRLISDVPVGAFLSGGVDSSAVVALMAAFSKEKIKTFSIGFDDKRFDESNYARRIASLYKTDHHAFQVNKETLSETFEKMADFYDEPFADNSAIPTLLLSKLTAKSLKVALTGDGGDENFAGYGRYSVVSFSDSYSKVPRSVRSTINWASRFIGSVVDTTFTRRLSTYAQTYQLPFYKKYLYYGCFFDNKTKNDLYSSEFRSTVNKFDSFNILENTYNTNISNIDNSLNFDINTYLPENLLFKTDIASMAYSLELRSPFLDHDLVEFTAKMPSSLKINLLHRKKIFKRVLEKNNLVPRDILDRPKRGFIAPIDDWLKGSQKGFVQEQLAQKKFKDSNIFDNVKLGKYVQDYFSGSNISPNNIFALLSLSAWIRKYL